MRNILNECFKIHAHNIKWERIYIYYYCNEMKFICTSDIFNFLQRHWSWNRCSRDDDIIIVSLFKKSSYKYKMLICIVIYLCYKIGFASTMSFIGPVVLAFIPTILCYDAVYDKLDADKILADEALFTSYIDCFLDKKPCTVEYSAEFKSESLSYSYFKLKIIFF